MSRVAMLFESFVRPNAEHASQPKIDQDAKIPAAYMKETER